MDTNTIITLFSNFILLLAIGFTYHFQRKKIESLQTESQSSKNIIENMERYASFIDKLFNSERIEKEIERINRRAKEEMEEKLNQDMEKHQLKEREYIAFFKKRLNEVVKKFGEETVELFNFCSILITCIEPKYRKQIIRDGIENETFRSSLLEVDKITGNAQFSDGFILHELVKAISGKPSVVGTVSRAPKEK
ncbi:MAG: hypothetical protein GWN01_01085 [Nitrosopumilaceae archaeon]|nr:hypothetical protein [Nitrosopumilaceae archaeon]NIU85952.1 hypothetical protein [Nitrosopumilaceae archaeon]NIV64776.1 hypothetical protein [Nitrosopumilaceae archaeon]NIX60174.1 hypothetical protein [Nitrosopumilaceae archaeon]